MVSKCPKCEGREFTIDEQPIENSNSVSLVRRCNVCGFVVNSCINDNPCETDDLLSTIEKLYGIEKDDFKVVSMKNGY